MQTIFSEQQVMQLAPDASSSKAGLGLAKMSQWQQPGRAQNMVWGLCQGSGKEPYRTQVDLSEPAFRCSCPSRKFPCKHGLALLLLLARDASQFAEAEMPQWVVEWQASRLERKRAKETAAQDAAAVAEKTEVQTQAQTQVPSAESSAPNKRAQQRMARVATGVQDALRWLEDLVRTGLIAAQKQPYAYWDGFAARMVDAQAPGLARRIRQIPAKLTGQDWDAQLLAEIGNIYLLLQAFTRLESLPLMVQADVRTALGFTQEQQQVLQQEAQRANWLVLGSCSEQEEQLTLRRTWLQKENSAQVALLLEFSVSQQRQVGLVLPVGAWLQAEVVYFPASVAQRALLKPGFEMVHTASAGQDVAGFTELDAMLAHVARQRACNAWLERNAALLCQMYLVQRAGQWHLRDAKADVLPLSAKLGEQIWILQAVSAGAPFDVFGEWDGQTFLPLSILHRGQWQPLQQESV